MAAEEGASPPTVFTLVLTGGPCGGKSTALSRFSEALTARGFAVFCVPEVPTILMQGGCQYPGMESDEKLMEFETGVIQLQMAAEDAFLRIARGTQNRPAVVVMDRGLLDIAAYLPSEQWQRVLQANGLTEEALSARYDMVLHLTTAADGAEKFYTTANNSARKETPEQARALDKKFIANWSRTHPAVTVVKNGEGGFDAKCAEATAAVIAMVEKKRG